MIVDFVGTKEKLHRGINILLRDEVKKRTPFLSNIGSRILHEGDKHSYETADKQQREMNFERGESSFSLTNEEMNKITMVEIVTKIKVAAEDMAGQMERSAFKTIFDDLEKNNRNIPGNPELTPDALLKGLEIIEIDFEDGRRDKPQLPTLIVHPKVAEKMKEQEAALTAEEKIKFNEAREKILDQKFEDFLRREGVRKIVD